MAYRNNSIVDGPGSGNPDDPYDFEKGRIRALRDEHLYIQKKTFTKWVNSFLIKCRIEVSCAAAAPVEAYGMAGREHIRL